MENKMDNSDKLSVFKENIILSKYIESTYFSFCSD